MYTDNRNFIYKEYVMKDFKNFFLGEHLEKIIATLSTKNEKKFNIKFKHIYATTICAAVILVGTTTVFAHYQLKLNQTSSQLEEAATDNEKLSAENEEYSQQLETLNEKADEIQAALQELDEAKQEIYSQISDGSEIENQSFAGQGKSLERSAAFSDDDSEIMAVSTKIDFFERIVSKEKEELYSLSQTVEELAHIPSIWPCVGILTSDYGYRSDVTSSSEFHAGIDIGVKEGTAVKATASGTVIYSGFSTSGYGNYVIIDHGNGIQTSYAHNSSLCVSEGDTVQKGDIIAYSGATGQVTGPHLHYEVLVNGENVDPIAYVTE